MSKKVFAVIKREYWTRAKTKGFIIGTLIFPLMLVLIFGGIFIFSIFFQPSTKTYYVIDETNKIFDEFSTSLSDTLKNGSPKFNFVKMDILPDNMEEEIKSIQKEVVEKKIYGYMLIPKDILENRTVKYSAQNVSDFEEQHSLSRAISNVVKNIRLQNLGLDPQQVRDEMDKSWIRLVSSQITDKGEIEKSGTSSFILTYILTYVMFLMMMIYGGMVMRSVIEEKSQRITESIVSAIKPIELMFGKVMGICALGLTQLAVFGIMLSVIVTYGEKLFLKFGVTDTEFLNVIRQINFSPMIFLSFLFYFLMGFIFYSCVFAAIGAIVNSEDEGQQFTFPIIIPIILSYFIMFNVAKNPDTTMAFWASIFPFFTPIVMFGRIAVSDPVMPSGFILSIFTMIGFTALMFWLTAKIYRVGILMYGKKPSIKEAIKWIKYK